MFLNQTTKYALRVLMEMAEVEGKMYSSQYLHQKLKIPKRYLMRLLTDLSKHGYIKSTRGRIGGFTFNMKPEEIYLSTVIDSLEGLKKYQACFFGNEDCQLQFVNKCAMHDPWQNTWSSLYEVLTTTTIGDLNKGESIQILD